MSQQPARRVRLIELAGLPGTGKTTVLRQLRSATPVGHGVVQRQPLHGQGLARRRLAGVLWRHRRHAWTLYRLFCPVLGMRSAGTRAAKYLQQLWRRQEQVRQGRWALILEDEGFIAWAARDCRRCPAFADWFRQHAALFYPPRVDGIEVEYLVLPMPVSEWLRVQRVLRRRLARGRGPAYARRKTEENGIRQEWAGQHAAVLHLVGRLEAVTLAGEAHQRAALARDPLAPLPARETT